MEFFDGKYKSKPKISLAGSSRQLSRDKLIQEAILERKKREEEKRQLQAALKIQSAFRSFAVRQRLKNQMRSEFKKMFDLRDPSNLKELISYFTVFYNERLDHQDLAKLCQFTLKHKDAILSNLVTERDSAKSFEFSLVKFLMIIFKTLNKSRELSDSVALRLIDFFTDPKSYAQFNGAEGSLSSILNFFLRHGFIEELLKYAQAKIPDNASQAPLVFVIGHFLHRAFLYLDLQKKLNSNSNSLVANTLCTQFFTKCQSSGHVRLLLSKLAQIIGEAHERDKMLANLVDFVQSLSDLVEFGQVTFVYEDYVSVLYSVLALCTPLIDHFSSVDLHKLINLLHLLIFKAFSLDFSFENATEKMSLDDEDEMSGKQEESEQEEVFDALAQAIALIESKQFVDRIEWLLVDVNERSSSLISFISFLVIEKSTMKPHQSLFLRKIAFNKLFLSCLWRHICSSRIGSANEFSYLQVLASGSCAKVYFTDLYKIIAPLSTFCSLYNLFLLPILDAEFLKGEAIFTKLELIKMSSIMKDVCTGLIQLMHPDTSFSNIIDLVDGHAPRSFSGTGFTVINTADSRNKASIDSRIKKTTLLFAHLFQTCSQLVQRLFTRDIRSGFCPEEHWLTNYQLVSLSRLSDILHTFDPSILTNIKFGQASHLFHEEFEKENKLNVSEIRSLAILQELPFTIGFLERMKILESFIHQETRYSPADRTYKLRVRRDFMYEDAFDNLSLENVPNLKNIRIVVEMVNQLGLDEAGVDGGGLFREFVLSLLENAFDPIRGFFLLTSDGFLYPNPNVGFIIENYEQHYFFLGRILGKAIQSKILSSLKFAMFFLQKILGKYTDTRLDIDYLASLDPEVYKNLIFLKNLKSNIEDLDLNFAINVNEFGNTKTIELKSGGKDIQVTSDNKIEYIHLLADYKLNMQIHNQVVAFRNGLANVIDLDLIRLFNFNELQYLISGSDETIDVHDWQMNTAYSGTYNSEHPVIKNFWRVVESLSEEHKRKLLRFVTSRSRMPLFGFKNLIPIFAIHSSGSEERLPSASTCLNLLKLPPIEDFNLLKEKIICAIESDSGFELS